MVSLELHKKLDALGGEKTERWPCVCAFAKDCNEKSPYAFPRVGFWDGVLYRGGFLIEHKVTGRQAYEPPTKECCPDWFNKA